MTESEVIKSITNGEESECSCKCCQHMCKKTPCIGTPSDILKIMDAGHIDKLELTSWGVGLSIGLPIIEMVQPRNDYGCVFQKDNQCILHATGLKPTEGRLTKGCKVDIIEGFKMPVAFAVARTWLLKNNQQTIIEIARKMGEFIKSQNCV